jgi:hypothetical protein
MKRPNEMQMLCRSEEIQVLCVVEKSANMFSKVNKLQIASRKQCPCLDLDCGRQNCLLRNCFKKTMLDCVMRRK